MWWILEVFGYLCHSVDSTWWRCFNQSQQSTIESEAMLPRKYWFLCKKESFLAEKSAFFCSTARRQSIGQRKQTNPQNTTNNNIMADLHPPPSLSRSYAANTLPLLSNDSSFERASSSPSFDVGGTSGEVENVVVKFDRQARGSIIHSIAGIRWCIMNKLNWII